jgi:GAF domain-containing protein
MLNEKRHQELQNKSIQIIKKDISLKRRMQELCDMLQKETPHYDWVGFYLKNGDKEELKLGPYTGEPTEHTLIPFGSGICGRVAVEERTINVDDVRKEDNYIACSISTRSELVVPIMRDGKFLGQIDVDSDREAAFSVRDERLLQSIARRMAEEFD